MSKIIYSIFMALVLLVPGSILMTTTNAEASIEAELLIVNGGVHDINLKATMEKDEDIKAEEDFTIDPADVVQTSENQLQIIATTGVIEKVKVVDAAMQTIELQALPNNAYDISGALVGAYLLDVIVKQPDGDKAAYETVLVILAEGQPALTIQQITNIIKIVTKVDVKIVFRESKNDTKPIVNNTKPPVGNETETEPNHNISIPILDPIINDTESSVLNDTESDEGFIEMPPTPEPTDKCWDINAGKPIEDCLEEEQDTDDGLPDYVPPTDEEGTDGEESNGVFEEEQNLEVEEEEESEENEEESSDESFDEGDSEN